jgi:hypothetical protein
MAALHHLRLVWVFATIFALAGCAKDRFIRNDDAADEISNALSRNTGGLAYETDQKTIYIQTTAGDLPCNQPTEVTRQFQLNAGIRSGAFIYNWVVTKNCSGALPFLEWTSTFSGSYEGPRLQGSSSGTRTWVATGIEPESENWVLNGSSSRSGSHQSRTRRRQGFDSEVTANFTDVHVRKSTRTIVSGSAEATITLTDRRGNTRTYEADITFDSGGLFTITVSGEAFILDLYQ